MVETASGTSVSDNLIFPSDTDNDGHPDYVEIGAGSDATIAGSIPADIDEYYFRYSWYY